MVPLLESAFAFAEVPVDPSQDAEMTEELPPEESFVPTAEEVKKPEEEKKEEPPKVEDQVITLKVSQLSSYLPELDLP